MLKASQRGVRINTRDPRGSKDCVRLTESSEAFIYVAMSRLTVRHLARV